MNETKTYRYTGPGRHWAYVGEGKNRKHVLLEIGDEVQLTDANYVSLRDRFELVTGAETPEPAVGAEEEDEPADGNDTESDDEDAAAAIVAGNVTTAVTQIAKISDFEFLEEVREAEKLGKARAGVYNALDDRESELEEE